jgi:hypothetical protein
MAVAEQGVAQRMQGEVDRAIARSVKGANGSKREIVLLSHDAVLSQAQLELYGLADVF